METSQPSSQHLPQEKLVPNPAAIIVPRRHGDVLIEPSAAELADFLVAAESSTRPSGSLDGIPIRTLASLARGELIDAMTRFANEIGFDPPPTNAGVRPWVITGHQVELYHPGVWSKVILADALAKQSNSLAVDLLVDHDTVDQLGCVVPQWSGSKLEKKLITWADATAIPAEFLSSPQGGQKTRWLGDLRRFPLVQTDSLQEFMHQWQEDTDPHYVSWMSRSRKRFERSFHINVQHVPCSYLCSGLAWHCFVLLWLRHAHAWCKTYNFALDTYRRKHEITNPGRPMPNLAIAENLLELPFWIYATNQPRHRLILQENDRPYMLYAARRVDVSDLLTGDLLAAGEMLRQRLHAANVSVRPRALTLTMFVRLLLSDLFIHGIGGALYDQMTDQIMMNLFGVRPAYACASAGWLLPLAGFNDQKIVNIPQLKWQEHHLRANPEQLAGEAHLNDKTQSLLEERRTLIAGINQSLITQRAEHRRRGPYWSQRRLHFQHLHDINAQLLEVFAPQMHQMQSQIREAELAAKNLSVAGWREYFIALHPRSSLRELIATIQSKVTSGRR